MRNLCTTRVSVAIGLTLFLFSLGTLTVLKSDKRAAPGVLTQGLVPDFGHATYKQGMGFLTAASAAFNTVQSEEAATESRAYAIMTVANREIREIFKSLQMDSEQQLRSMFMAEFGPSLDKIVNDTNARMQHSYELAKRQLDETEQVIGSQDTDNQAQRVRLGKELHDAKEQAAYSVGLAKKTLWKWVQNAHKTFTKEAAKIPGQKYFKGT